MGDQKDFSLEHKILGGTVVRNFSLKEMTEFFWAVILVKQWKVEETQLAKHTYSAACKFSSLHYA